MSLHQQPQGPEDRGDKPAGVPIGPGGWPGSGSHLPWEAGPPSVRVGDLCSEGAELLSSWGLCLGAAMTCVRERECPSPRTDAGYQELWSSYWDLEGVGRQGVTFLGLDLSNKGPPSHGGV